MIRSILQTLFILSAVAIQVAFLPHFIVSDFKPDLLLIIVVFLALRADIEAALLCWIIGILKDAYSGTYLGLNAFIYLVIFVTIKTTAERLYAESGELFILAVSLSTIAATILSSILVEIFTPSHFAAYSIISEIIPQTLVNAFLASLTALLPMLFYKSLLEQK